MDLNTIYLVCAVAGGTVLVLRLLLMITGFGGGDDVSDIPTDLDAGVDADFGGHDAGETGAGANFVSIQSLSGFFTMFGLVGMGLLEINASPVLSLVGALAAGGVTAWATTMIVLNLQRLQSSGNLVITNAIGQQGTVYLTIPEKGSGVVMVTVQGALRQFDAVSGNGQRIPTGEVIRVTGITAGKVLVVEPLSINQPSTISGG
jgi:hypothetical protein